MTPATTQPPLGDLFVALIEEGPGPAEYLHVKHSDGVSYIPVWLSPAPVTKYLAHKGIKGTPVVFSQAGYRRSLKWHQDVGSELFLQLQLSEGDV
jgi:hypothetical protein